MSTLEVNSLIHLDASSNNLDLDSSGNATVNGNMTATQFYGGGGNLTGVGVDGIVSTANATAITIDSNEKVSVGGTPTGRLVNFTTTDQTDIAIISGNNQSSQLCFGDPQDDNIGVVAYNNATDAMTFKTNTTERLRITSDGNVHINETGTPYPIARFHVKTVTAGRYAASFRHDGNADTDLGIAIVCGKNTGSSGVVAVQFKDGDGSDVGKIYHTGTGTYYNTGNSGGIDFSLAGNDSGMTSEILDDYEEGTWTPTLQDSSNNAATYLQNEGGYTKIGRTVNVFGTIYINSLSGVGSSLKTAGLPFANGTGSGTGHYSAASIGSMRIMNIGSGMALSGPIWKGESHINWSRSYMTSNNNPVGLDAGHLGYGSQWTFQMTYQTD